MKLDPAAKEVPVLYLSSGESALKRTQPNNTHSEKITLQSTETEQGQQEANTAELPPHIKALAENLERLKQEKQDEQYQLEALKAETRMDAAVKEELVDIQSQRVWQLESRILLATQVLQQAMRDAKLSDVGVVMNLLA